MGLEEGTEVGERQESWKGRGKVEDVFRLVSDTRRTAAD